MNRPMAATSEPGFALVPVPKAVDAPPPKRGAAPIGLLLEKTRRRLGYSVDTVCAALFLTERELNQYESGMREPPPGDLERLAEFFGVDVSRFRPDAAAETEHADHDVLWLGWAAVELDEFDERSNRTTVPRIAHTIRSMRSMAERAPITIRDHELVQIGMALSLHDDDLPTLMIECFSLSAQQAFELVARLQYAVASTKELPEASNVDVAARERDPDA